MNHLLKVPLKFVFYPVVLVRRYLYGTLWFQALSLYWSDYRRYIQHAGAMERFTERSSIARIIMAYHVVEKGLTMPNRRHSFGHGAVRELMSLISRHVLTYGCEHPQVLHAIGVVRAYDEMHRGSFSRTDDEVYWKSIEDFLAQYPETPPQTQRHMTREEFFAKRDAVFPEFARSRHTLRHYAGPVDVGTIRKAVSLAQCAPSACNRQHIRVYCVSDHTLRDKIFSLQNGNRGFGYLADKLLVLTGDLEDIRWLAERHDVYTNGGIFLMNLCYALHYYGIAHCILNASFRVAEEQKMRELLRISESEVFVALVCCGQPPDEFDIASSPRRDFSEIFFERGTKSGK